VQNVVPYGVLGNSSYALELAYRSENGSRPNNDLEQLSATAKFKQQVTPHDSVFFQATYFKAESGDLAQYYDQTNAQTGLRVKETQEPLLLAGWHHEWHPGAHTLVLGGHWQDTLQMTDPAQAVFFLRRPSSEQVNGVPYPRLPSAAADYRSEFEGYTAELQQIFKTPCHGVVFGARFQTGTFDTRSALGESTLTSFAIGTNVDPGRFSSPAVSTHFVTDFQRLSFYGYDYWQIADPLLLTAGLSYDRLSFPVNFRYPPVASGQDTTGQVSPKAGLIWTPFTNTTLRGAYSQSLGGVSFDQSFQLEPSQVAGFNQAYRSLIPESAVGSLAGAKFETIALSLEQKIGPGTYVGAQAERLGSEARRTLGTSYLVDEFPNRFAVGSTRERFDYTERNLVLTLNQLVGNNWSFGARYRLSDADLDDRLPDIPLAVTPAAHTDVSATLQQVNLFALFNHESGVFSRFDSIWSHQSNRGYTPALPGDDFWQFNLSFGYRFWQRRMEAKLALLNLTSRDYRLNPLNLATELPRQRTLVASFRFNF
jgi:outer membrane receptor protein involved in Fe transport